MRRKLVLLFLIINISMILSSCSGKSNLVNFVMDKFTVKLNERAEMNINILGELKDSGIISGDLHDRIKNKIVEETNKMVNDVKAINRADKSSEALSSEAASRLANKAPTAWLKAPLWVDYIDDKGEAKVIRYDKIPLNRSSNILEGKLSSGGTYASFCLGNYIVRTRTTKKSGSDGEEVDLSKNATESINFFGNLDKELEDTLNEKFKLPIYVFDPSTITDKDASLDAVLASINKAVEKNDISGLTNYFKPLLDNNNKQVTLMEDDFKIYGHSKKPNDINMNRPGYDLTIKQSLYMSEEPIYKKGKIVGYRPISSEEPVCQLRFHEFYADAIEVLRNTISLNSEKYYFQLTSSGTKAAYLLEYPVSVFGKVSTVDKKGKKFIKIDYKDDSGLGINIGSGKVICYDRDINGFKNSGVVLNPDGQYLTTAFSESNNTLGKSSFITKGFKKHKIDRKSITNKNTIEVIVPRIILRDYLEATWAPGIINSPEETIVVFGRKIRFKTDKNFWKKDGHVDKDKKYPVYKLHYNLNDKALKVAYFVDLEGSEVGSLHKLKIQDFANISSMEYGSSKNKWDGYKLQVHKEKAEAEGETKGTADSNNKTPKIDEITKEVKESFSSFNMASAFPGKTIGSVDYNNNSETIQRFYAVATRDGMFESSLYGDWINSQSQNASLTWWNKWLADHGYSYKVGEQDVNEYLADNFKFELSQNGIVILDLNTVSKIKDIYSEEDRQSKSSFIRTIFIVLGYIVIAYSVILMLGWVADVHTDMGLHIVSKLTFGFWTPVSSENDIPTMKNNYKSYVDRKRLVIKVIILVFIGTILVVVNINKIILIIIDIFGRIAIWLQENYNLN